MSKEYKIKPNFSLSIKVNGKLIPSEELIDWPVPSLVAKHVKKLLKKHAYDNFTMTIENWTEELEV